MDVKLAFLNGLLNEEIFMEQPQGFITPGQADKVCLLIKVIYRLKQALCTWNIQIHGVLLELGFMCIYFNVGIYMYLRHEGKGIVIIILYVNDITLLGDGSKEISQIKLTLSSCFEMTDLGEIDSYLRVHIMRDQSIKRLEIDQSQYILEIVDCFGQSDANLACTLLSSGSEVHLVKHNEQATPVEIN